MNETCEVCGRVDHPAYMCWRVGHLINEATARAHPEYAMPVESSGGQIPSDLDPLLTKALASIEKNKSEPIDEWAKKFAAHLVRPDSFTRQQVEAMLHVALTVRTDEWTSNSVDERVSILLAMFTKEKS